MTSPRRRATMSGSTAVANRLAPIRCTWICDRKASELISWIRPGNMSPAPDTSSSISPIASIDWLTNAFTDSGSVMSSW